jgi:hypothetical protein
MTDATRFDETDTTLIPAGEGQYGTVDDGLRQDPAAPQRPSLRETVKGDRRASGGGRGPAALGLHGAGDRRDHRDDAAPLRSRPPQ